MQVYEKGSDAVNAVLSLADDLPSRESIERQRARLIRELEYIPEVMQKQIKALTGVSHV
jgi:hypothetical protein